LTIIDNLYSFRNIKIGEQINILLICLILCIPSIGFSAETCSRVAYINYQEVLVDTSSTKLGEGLRYYLEKDKMAKKLLDEYQYRNKPTFERAALSTTGSVLLFAGLLNANTGKDESTFTRSNLMISGSILIALSYLSTITIRYRNESLLESSIEQYNKRNLPKIYFSPYNEDGNSPGVNIGFQKDF
jgi:hypothetical protein